MKRRPLDHSQSGLGETLTEWVDGFLFGDGHLRKISEETACATFSSSNPCWIEYAMSGFRDYLPISPKERPVVQGKRGPLRSWQSWTLSHPDLKYHQDRWYGTGKKKIPVDVRVTGTSLRLWYLGDGSLDKGFVRIAAYDFTEEEMFWIVGRVKDELGIVFTRQIKPGHGTGEALYLPAQYTPRFFDLIGRDCPVPGYEYKFDVAETRWMRSLINTAEELKVSSAWLENHVRSGRIHCTQRGEGWKFLTQEEFEKVQMIRDKEYQPRSPELVGTKRLNGSEVIEILKIHPRRLPVLVETAGITPHRTPGGQYRFTEEEVEKMRPLSVIRHSIPGSRKEE